MVPLLEMGRPFPVLVNCMFGYLHMYEIMFAFFLHVIFHFLWGGGKFDGLSLYILLYVTTVSSGSDYHYHIYYFEL